MSTPKRSTPHQSGVHVASCARPGRVTPLFARRLRARVVRLPTRGVMEWHSTGRREELIVALAGRIRLELRPANGRLGGSALSVGRCAFVPSETLHRVVNVAAHPARYLYVTAT